VLGVVLGSPLGAQETAASRTGIDQLKFSGVGMQVGVVRPAQVEAATSYTLQADYGSFAPGWRVIFAISYWESRFTDAAVREFADSLEHVIVDPTNDARVILGDIRVSDLSVGTDVRRETSPAPWFRVYFGAGLAAHILNADGRLIDGTFVERATDAITTGLAGVAGADLRLFGHIALGVQARYDLLSLARYGSLRFGGSYFFDREPSRPRTP
jgi:hypothetical protein